MLATDGEPDTCLEPNPQNGQEEAVAAAEQAFAMGIKTSIISVGADVSAAHLQDMANAGAGVQAGDPDAPYYQALDQQSLLDAFNEIINGDRSCQIALMDAVKPALAGECTVMVNMSEVPYDDPNGWQLNDPNEIELVGSACDSIQDGDVSVEMVCDCEALE